MALLCTSIADTCRRRPASSFVFEDHAVEEGADDVFLFWIETGDGFELKSELVIGAAFVFAE